MISNKHDLFEMVEKLSDQRPFDPARVENLTKQSLENIKSKSNEYFSFFKSKNSNSQDKDDFSIKLRVPKPESNTVDGILTINLSIKMCITQDDVRNKYGFGEPWPPDPNMPDDIALFYLSYKYDWGEVSYGFKVIGQECLSSVVLDATKK